MNLPGDPPRRDHGVQPDDRGQDQPADKTRAQQSSGDKSRSDMAQRDAGRERPPSPGQPAGGE